MFIYTIFDHEQADAISFSEYQESIKYIKKWYVNYINDDCILEFLEDGKDKIKVYTDDNYGILFIIVTKI